jgi:mannitol 2-dehydrogenase
VASWARYAEGTGEHGETYEMDDDLADDPRFTEVCSSILASLSERGVRRTFTDLDRYAAPSMASHDPAGLERKSP